MPCVVFIPGGFYVATEADLTKHFERIALDLGELGCDKSFADVNIHCRNKIFKTNCNSKKEVVSKTYLTYVFSFLLCE